MWEMESRTTMLKGDVVLASAPGDYGKPRPYLTVQSNTLTGVDSVVLCPLTTDVQALSFRVVVEPGRENGLARRSEVMVDKVLALPRSRVRAVIGALDPFQMTEVDAALRLLLGL